MNKFMESFTPVLIYMVGVLSCYLVMTYQTGKTSHKITEEFNQYKVSTTNAIMDLTKTLNSNIMTVGNANLAITEVKKDLACFVAKVDKTDAELENLQDHCYKLRESMVDVREIVASKRPIHRHQPISVTIAPEILKPGDPIMKLKKTKLDAELLKKTKKQLKDFEQ